MGLSMSTEHIPDPVPGLPDITEEEARMNINAHRRLLRLLFGYFVLYLSVVTLLAHRAISIVTAKGTPFEASDLIIFGFAYTLLFSLLTMLPILMVAGYQELQGPAMMERLRASLTLCGLPARQIDDRMREYTSRNSFQTFLLPVGISLAFLVVLWGSVLFPHGVGGILDNLEVNGHLHVSLDRVLQHVAAEALVENWVFLGAYFYALTTMVRRWMQSDLTTNVLWKLNVRFAITVLIGLLFTALFTDVETLQGKPEAWVLSLAFTAGLVPDVFLRWLAQQAKHLIGNGNGIGGPFSPSDLQKKIDGMSFWQADRLAEEGIESVQDLAMKDIPDLLIRTRFDPALLFSWVDRALLWNQAGVQTPWLKRANIRGASQLMFLVQNRQDSDHAFDSVLTSLQDALDRSPPPTTTQSIEQGLAADLLNIDPSQPLPLSPAMLANLVSGLRHGPNLHYICNYWQQISGDSAIGNACPVSTWAPIPAPAAAAANRNPSPTSTPGGTEHDHQQQRRRHHHQRQPDR